MTNNADLKNTIMDVQVEFYEKYMKPETRKMIEEVLEEKFDEKLAPIKASIISIEQTMGGVTGDFKGQHMQLMDHEKRIITIEKKVTPH
jgi:hypothetical protein